MIDRKSPSLKEQFNLIRKLVIAKKKGGWDQQAADRLGNYMISKGIKSIALRGYYAEISDKGLYVQETPISEYGAGYYLRVEYLEKSPD